MKSLYNILYDGYGKVNYIYKKEIFKDINITILSLFLSERDLFYMLEDMIGFRDY
jgi:hypothetical protein